MADEWRGVPEESAAHILERQACGGCDCCRAHAVNLEDLVGRAVAHGREEQSREVRGLIVGALHRWVDGQVFDVHGFLRRLDAAIAHTGAKP